MARPVAAAEFLADREPSRASGSARSAGSIRARRPRDFRRRARPAPDSGSCPAPDRWSWPDARGRAAQFCCPARAASDRNAHKRAGSRGASEIDQMSDTGPSVWVCRMKRPSNLSAEPSSVVSMIASPSSLPTRRRMIGLVGCAWRRAQCWSGGRGYRARSPQTAARHHPPGWPKGRGRSFQASCRKRSFVERRAKRDARRRAGAT